MNNLSKKQIDLIKNFIKIIQTKVKIKRNIQREVILLKQIIYNIIERIKISYVKTILNQNEYQNYMNSIEVCIGELQKGAN